jgi:urease accessory protein
MRAFARIVAEADGRGGTRLTALRGESPLLPRRTGARAGAGVTVHLVGGAAGPSWRSRAARRRPRA